MSFLSAKQIAACVKHTLRVRHLDVILVGLQGTFAGAPAGTDTIIETVENGIDFSCRKGREHYLGSAISASATAAFSTSAVAFKMGSSSCSCWRKLS